MSDRNASPGRVYALLAILGMLVLGFVSGAFSARFGTFPYPQLLEQPFRALAAFKQKEAAAEGSVLRTGLWHPTRSETRGVSRHDPQRSWGQLTLYTSGDHTGAYLVDASGELVHEWSASFRSVWPDHPGVDEPVPESRIYWRRVHLFPDGDLLASYSGEGDTPYGYGLAKFDADSELIWKYSGDVHHDFAVRDDGSIVALSHQFRNFEREPLPEMPQFRKTALEDRIVVLSSDGDVRREFSILDAFADSTYRALLDMYPSFIGGRLETRWDPLHANTVNIVGPEFAEKHDFADPGDVATSFRNADAVALLDPSSGEVEWAARGFWRQQHDPDPLPNGNILLFDNNGSDGPSGPSRLLEFDPGTNEVHWTYKGFPGAPFWSVGRSSQQRLPNGNILVTESAGGRIFEITRDGDIVWEFYNPRRRQANGRAYVPILCSGRRYERAALDFIEPAPTPD